jgi:hypothetical protein
MKKLSIAISFAAIVFAVLAMGAQAATSYFQGFETDTVDWTGVTRVASGTHGIVSATGGWHAEATHAAAPGTTNDLTHFGGYESVFPSGGYTTRIAVYLDVAANANDTRFDWSTAINDATGNHRRDFVFNAGFYNDADALTGSGPRFVVSASNNASRSGAFPKNPGKAPFTITTSGWYTLQHEFYAGPGGVLKVDMSIIGPAGGLPLTTWTLSDPSDIIGTTVGGHRYGWLVIQELPVLAIDNVSLVSIAQPSTANACKNEGWESLTRADGSAFKNQGDCVSYVNTSR